MEHVPRTLLAHGQSAAWETIERVDAERRSAEARDQPVEELLRRGQQLSGQAMRLLRAVLQA